MLRHSTHGDVVGVSFTSVALATKVHPSSLDETSQVMLGVVLVVLVGFFIAIIFALQVSSTKNGSTFERDDFIGSAPGSARHLSGAHLNETLTVPEGRSMSYYLPYIFQQQQRKSLEAFKILSESGKQVLGFLVNDSNDDPGILLHASTPDGRVGSPMAFISTHSESLHDSKLRIAWPSTEHPRGEMFGTLEPDGDGFKVMREGHLLLSIEGGSQNYTLHDASGKSIGTTTPAGDNYSLPLGFRTTAAAGDNFIDLQLRSGADAALAVVCILAVMKLNASTI